MRITVTETTGQFDAVAADEVCAAARERPDAVLGLPSGRTPAGMYLELARRAEAGETDLSRVRAFAIDELHGVPPSHPATNASYFREHAYALGLGELLVMDSEAADAAAECARFAAAIADAGGLDLAVLGIGVNGHLAFNEPGSPFDSRARRVALTDESRAPYAAHFGSPAATPSHGLTLGLADLMEARRVLLLASGATKADAVARALEGPVTEDVPASALQRHGDLVVVLDAGAAAGLRRPHAG